MTAATGRRPSGLVEIVSDTLYRLGGVVALDQRISWVPPGRQGLHPVNCYLVRDGGSATMVDTGFAVFGEQILDQLAAVLRPGTSLSVFLTRAEYESVGNLARLNLVYPVERLLTGGIVNVFDAYSEVAGFADLRSRQDMLARMAAGEAVPVAGSDRLEVISAPLRILATYWLYDRLTRTLFTSDAFGYGTVSEAGDGPVTTARDADVGSDEIAAHVNVRFDWLPGARTTEVRDQVIRIFAERPVEIIAPSHGRVLRGAGVVRRHVDELLRVLEDDGVDAEPAGAAG